MDQSTCGATSTHEPASMQRQSRFEFIQASRRRWTSPDSGVKPAVSQTESLLRIRCVRVRKSQAPRPVRTTVDPNGLS